MQTCRPSRTCSKGQQDKSAHLQLLQLSLQLARALPGSIRLAPQCSGLLAAGRTFVGCRVGERAQTQHGWHEEQLRTSAHHSGHALPTPSALLACLHSICLGVLGVLLVSMAAGGGVVVETLAAWMALPANEAAAHPKLR